VFILVVGRIDAIDFNIVIVTASMLLAVFISWGYFTTDITL